MLAPATVGRLALAVLLLVPLASAQRGRGRAAVAEGPAPANILILLADDLGVDQVGVYGEGADLPPTPNIDQLAADGIWFRNAWANPVCSPTRANLLTGRYAFRHGVGFGIDFTPLGPQGRQALARGETTLPEMLDQGTGGAYASAVFGKWHLGTQGAGGNMAPNLVGGFQHFAGTITNLVGVEDYYQYAKITNGVQTNSTTYATTETVDDTLAWIATAPEPWIAVVAFHAPHQPFQNPPPGLHSVTLEGTLRSTYKAMVNALDTEIGRLLGGVDDSDTTVMFMGDNGTPPAVAVAPFDGAKAKGTLYEGGVNVPFVIRGPDVVDPGRVEESIISITDVFATVADLAGVDLEATLPDVTLDSVSLYPYMVSTGTPPLRDYAYAELFLPNRSQPSAYAPPCSAPIDQPICQDDLGFSGPGSTSLSICGPELYGLNKAQFLLQGAPAFAISTIYVGLSSNPTPEGEGTLVPFPAFPSQIVQTNALGEFTTQVLGGLGEGEQFFQMVTADAGVTGGASFSNAVRAQVHGADVKAVRGRRYKLIQDASTCQEQLYNILVDPFETNDLLLGTLTPGEQEELEELRQVLADLLEMPQLPYTIDGVAIKEPAPGF